jgi:hypothetical protein
MMSNNSFFRSKEEELKKLVQEISDLKSTMKEMSSSLTRIEKHVKRSFGIPPKSKAAGPGSRPSQTGAERKKEEPTITPEEALKLFDKLSEKWMGQDSSEIENELQDMIVPDLKLIAHELGLTFKGKPSKKTLCGGILSRLNERAMLSRNVNITAPRSGERDD